MEAIQRIAILLATFSYLQSTIKCLIDVNIIVFVYFIILIIIKTLYIIVKFVNSQNINLTKNTNIINYISTLFFTITISYYYLNEPIHEYFQIAFFIYLWIIQLLFSLLFYIEFKKSEKIKTI